MMQCLFACIFFTIFNWAFCQFLFLLQLFYSAFPVSIISVVPAHVIMIYKCWGLWWIIRARACGERVSSGNTRAVWILVNIDTDMLIVREIQRSDLTSIKLFLLLIKDTIHLLRCLELYRGHNNWCQQLWSREQIGSEVKLIDCVKARSQMILEVCAILY